MTKGRFLVTFEMYSLDISMFLFSPQLDSVHFCNMKKTDLNRELNTSGYTCMGISAMLFINGIFLGGPILFFKS